MEGISSVVAKPILPIYYVVNKSSWGLIENASLWTGIMDSCTRMINISSHPCWCFCFMMGHLNCRNNFVFNKTKKIFISCRLYPWLPIGSLCGQICIQRRIRTLCCMGATVWRR
jgi:hypothetical protein